MNSCASCSLFLDLSVSLSFFSMSHHIHWTFNLFPYNFRNCPCLGLCPCLEFCPGLPAVLLKSNLQLHRWFLVCFCFVWLFVVVQSCLFVCWDWEDSWEDHLWFPLFQVLLRSLWPLYGFLQCHIQGFEICSWLYLTSKILLLYLADFKSMPHCCFTSRECS